MRAWLKWFFAGCCLTTTLLLFVSVREPLDGIQIGVDSVFKSEPGDDVAVRLCGIRKLENGSNLEKRRIHSRSNLTVIANYKAAKKVHQCLDSVTFCTQGDPSYLKHLPALSSRWRGPMSVSVFAPNRGNLLRRTFEVLDWLVQCSEARDEIVANVTFHVITDVHDDFFADLEKEVNAERGRKTCSDRPMFGNDEKLKNDAKSLDFYPVNLARNVAREAATTHFVLVADIELFPNTNFIPMFLDMIHTDKPATSSRTGNPYVFVFPIFEVANSPEAKFPDTKVELKHLYTRDLAVTFHKYVCRLCHEIPEIDAWLFVDTRAPWEHEEKMKVFSVTKRTGERSWEPIFVGTKNDPLYDERLSWSGGSDKMFQMFEMCAKNYDLKILSNAFLVHVPGIKRSLPKRRVVDGNSQRIHDVKTQISAELLSKYGNNTGCKISF